MQVKVLIDRFLWFTKCHGQIFHDRVGERESHNPRFGFLYPNDPCHDYYKAGMDKMGLSVHPLGPQSMEEEERGEAVPYHGGTMESAEKEEESMAPLKATAGEGEDDDYDKPVADGTVTTGAETSIPVDDGAVEEEEEKKQKRQERLKKAIMMSGRFQLAMMGASTATATNSTATEEEGWCRDQQVSTNYFPWGKHRFVTTKNLYSCCCCCCCCIYQRNGKTTKEESKDEDDGEEEQEEGTDMRSQRHERSEGDGGTKKKEKKHR